MKYALLALGCLVLSGCAEKPPALSGGKPLGHWVEASKSPDAKLRQRALEKLGNSGATDESVTQVLLGGLQDTDGRVRRAAILALVKQQRPPANVRDLLAAAQTRDRDPVVRDYAAKALKKLQFDSNSPPATSKS